MAATALLFQKLIIITSLVKSLKHQKKKTKQTQNLKSTEAGARGAGYTWTQEQQKQAAKQEPDRDRTERPDLNRPTSNQAHEGQLGRQRGTEQVSEETLGLRTKSLTSEYVFRQCFLNTVRVSVSTHYTITKQASTVIASSRIREIQKYSALKVTGDTKYFRLMWGNLSLSQHITKLHVCIYYSLFCKPFIWHHLA